MPDKSQLDNPYASPLAPGRNLKHRTFHIGRDELHTIHLEISVWRGLKTHSVDAAGKATSTLRGPCRFQVGQREVHLVEVRVDATARISLLVDDELVEENVFSRARAVILSLTTLLALVLTGLAMALILTSKLFAG